MFAAEHSSYALVGTHNFTYTNLLCFRSQDHVPRDPRPFYPSRRRRMPQYELISAPTERRPASLVRHNYRLCNEVQ